MNRTVFDIDGFKDQAAVRSSCGCWSDTRGSRNTGNCWRIRDRGNQAVRAATTGRGSCRRTDSTAGRSSSDRSDALSVRGVAQCCPPRRGQATCHQECCSRRNCARRDGQFEIVHALTSRCGAVSRAPAEFERFVESTGSSGIPRTAPDERSASCPRTKLRRRAVAVRVMP